MYRKLLKHKIMFETLSERRCVREPDRDVHLPLSEGVHRSHVRVHHVQAPRGQLQAQHVQEWRNLLHRQGQRTGHLQLFGRFDLLRQFMIVFINIEKNCLELQQNNTLFVFYNRVHKIKKKYLT